MTKRKKKEWNLTDAKDMTPLNKGEILYYHKLGKKPKEIAGLTGRSMEWIRLICGGLAGWGGMDKLINLYVDKICKKESHNDKIIRRLSTKRPINGSTGEPLTEEETSYNVQSTPRLETTNNSGRKRTTRSVPKRKRSVSKVHNKSVGRPRSGDTGKPGIASKARKHKDYKGK
jgi:hypothetical protein